MVEFQLMRFPSNGYPVNCHILSYLKFNPLKGA